VRKVTAPKLGAILATRGRLALYTWSKEKDKKVHCTGSCAKAWPPLTIAKGTMVARRVAGVMGTFGEITRPDGTTQVTLDGRPLYTVAASMPRFDPATWRLQIDGLVEQPQSLTHDELRRLPRAEQVTTFHCVTGWSVKNVHWAGVRFRDLLAPARPHANGTVLTFVSAEKPYVDTLTLRQAELHDAMLAYEMDGKPLAREHGAPVRVVIPEMYGYKNVKWVERITVADQVEPGYWE